jgi:hypothetical protein
MNAPRQNTQNPKTSNAPAIQTPARINRAVHCGRRAATLTTTSGTLDFMASSGKNNRL